MTLLLWAHHPSPLALLPFLIWPFFAHLCPPPPTPLSLRCVIQLLLMCPPESASTRKDILVATRHILATDFRVGFFSQIDVLLDEKVLIGQVRHLPISPLISPISDLLSLSPHRDRHLVPGLVDLRALLPRDPPPPRVLYPRRPRPPRARRARHQAPLPRRLHLLVQHPRRLAASRHPDDQRAAAAQPGREYLSQE